MTFPNLNTIDKRLFLLLNGSHSPELNKIMFMSRNLVLWIPLFLIFLFIIVQYRRNKTRPHILTKTIMFFGFIILQFILCIAIFPHILDPIVHRERPLYDPDILQVVDLSYFYFLEKADFYSAKICLAAAIAAFFISFYNVPVWFKISLGIWTLLISYNRIYIGAHYPLNVLISMLLGIGVGLLTYHYYQYLKRSVMVIN